MITTHLTELIKENITDLLSYTETQKLIDQIGDEHKQLVSDIIPEVVTIATLQKVLQNLLSEMVSIRDLPNILESIADSIRANRNLMQITEDVRVHLSRQICHSYTNDQGFIPVISLSPEWEQTFVKSLVDDGASGKQLSMAPSQLKSFVASVNKVFDEQIMKGNMPVLLTSSYTRSYIRSVISRFRSSIVVMSQNEIHYKAKIKTLDTI